MDEEQGSFSATETPAAESRVDAGSQPGSESPAEAAEPEAAPGPVPYERFSEVVQARRQAEERLQNYSPWENALSQLQALGATPEAVLQQIAELQSAPANGYQQPPAPAPAQPTLQPEEQFQQFLHERGIDPEDLDQATYLAHFARWELQQMRSDLDRQRQEFQQQQEQQLLMARQQAQFAQVRQQNPALFNPETNPILSGLVQTVWAQWGGQIPMAKIADGICKEIAKYADGQVSTYAARKQQTSRVPVIAGGSAPPPLDPVQINRMSASERLRYVNSFLAAHQAEV